MSKKLNAETHAIIAAIEASNAAAKVLADAVAKELVAHTRLDDARHEENKQTLATISADVKSLLESRSYTRGLWKAATIAGAIAGTVISVIVAFVRGH